MTRTLPLLLCLLPIACLAQQYLPDQSFGTNGLVNTSFNTASNDVAYDVVEAPDGKLIIAGQTYTGMNDLFTVTRVSASGELDMSFGDGGKAFLFSAEPANWSDAAKVVRLLPDGKILVSGENEGKIVLTRLNDNGTFDASFGVNGYNMLSIGETYYSGAPTVEDMLVQQDGKILVAINYIPNPNSGTKKIAILRFDADGALDSTFDGDGIASISAGTSDDLVFSIKLQSDNKIVGCGSKSNTVMDSDFLAFRLNPDGSIDTTFDGDGLSFVVFSTGSNPIIEQAKRLEIQPDGKIILAGNVFFSSTFGLTRLNPNGSIDTSFGVSGKATSTLMTQNDKLTGLKLDPTGNIYLSGNTSFTTNGVKIMKYNSSGVRENTFGGNGNGIMIYGAPQRNTSTFLYWASNGSLGVGGSQNSKFAINYFSNMGLYSATTSCPVLTNGSGNAWNITQLPDGKYIASGGVVDGTNKTCVLKYNSDGTLDTSFGINGVYIDTLSSSNAEMVQAIQPDGKILFATPQGAFRLNADGTIDTTYGIMGHKQFQATMFVRGLAALPDGKMLLSGLNFNTFESFLTRQDANGMTDMTFGVNGFAEQSATDTSHQLFLQDDGKILLGGFTASEKLSVSRYLSNGMLDTTFGVNGNAIIPFQTNTSAAFGSRHLAVTTDGKIIVSGHTELGIGCIVRLNADGTVDTTYGDNGRVTNSDYTFVFTACAGPANTSLHGGPYISRYNNDGTRDMMFGEDGKIELPGDHYRHNVMQLLMQPDGKLMVAYDTTDGFTLARYNAEDLSTEDSELSNSIAHIYPNPVADETHVMFTLKQESPITIELFNIQGKLLKTYLKQEMQFPGDFDRAITMPNGLQAGTYVLRISSSNGANSIKLLKK